MVSWGKAEDFKGDWGPGECSESSAPTCPIQHSLIVGRCGDLHTCVLTISVRTPRGPNVVPGAGRGSACSSMLEEKVIRSP